MLFAAVLIAPALANDGPQPRLFAEAAGEVVTLKLELQAAGEPGLGEALDLVRVEGDDETVLQAGVVRDAADAEYETPYCKNWETDSTWGDDTGNGPWSCDDRPEDCEDCDGDGTNECQWGCVTWQGWTIEDSCVNAGEVGYEVRETDSQWGPAQDVSLTVEDVGQDCADSTTGPSDTGEGDDGGRFSCATAPSPRAGRLLLGLVMGLVGWLFFRRD